ncbi:antiterminator, partial [Yersinia enterocolitica]
MSTRGGDRMKKPSLITCRREVDEILAAAVWMLYQPMQHAFISRKRVGKIKKVA